MRGRVLRTFCGLVIVLAAGSARGGVLASASWVTEIRPYGLSTVSVSVPVIASGVSTATSVSVSLTVPAFITSFPVSAPPLLSPSATLSLGGSQVVNATPGMGSATMALSGAAQSRIPATTILRIPLAVGVAGGSSFTASFAFGVYHYITVDHYAWTPGTLTLTGLSRDLAPLPTVVTAGSFMLDANGAGTVTLVAPTRFAVQSSLPYRNDVAITRLTLHFVPEPGAWLMVAAAGLAIFLSRR